jgi:hypothetical protein
MAATERHAASHACPGRPRRRAFQVDAPEVARLAERDLGEHACALFRGPACAGWQRGAGGRGVYPCVSTAWVR